VTPTHRPVNVLRRIYDGVHRLGLALFNRIEASWNHTFGERYNLFYWLGTIPIFLLFVMLITGLYLFIYYSMAADTTYESVKYMTEQTLLGRYVRSLHRYAADAFLFFVLLHAVRMFVDGKYQNHRWLAWITGVGLLLFTIIQGITGYFMPLDATSRYVMEKTSELLAALGFLGNSLPRSFASPDMLGKWVMWVILIIHFAIPLLFIFVIFLHTKRISRARLVPPRPLATALLSVLILFAVLFPFKMQAPADPTLLPYLEQMDRFFLFLAPILQEGNILPVWLGFTLLFALLFGVPWFRKAPTVHTARIDIAHCTGCTLCSQDCPYEAIRMQPRTDDRKYRQEAVVDPNLCSGCGICVASCDFDGTYLDNLDRQAMTEQIHTILRDAPEGTWLGISCQSQSASLPRTQSGDRDPAAMVRFLTYPCVGMVGANLVEKAREAGAGGVLLVACPEGDCWYREGNIWTRERLTAQRKPHFNRTDPTPIVLLRANRGPGENLRDQINTAIHALPTTSQTKLRRVLHHVRTGRPFFHYSITTVTIALLLWFFFIGAAGRTGGLPLDTSRALLRMDFFHRTQPKELGTARINEDAVQEQVRRMTGSLKLDQLTEEARERILTLARESVTERAKSRERLPLLVTIHIDDQPVARQLFKPSGLQQDGLIYVLLKQNLTPGIHRVRITAVEQNDAGEAVRTYESRFEHNFLGGRVYWVDFNEHDRQFYFRNPS
jgi:quinol-cytochrome oxidoreductase complex cytochrome b subunit